MSNFGNFEALSNWFGLDWPRLEFLSNMFGTFPINLASCQLDLSDFMNRPQWYYYQMGLFGEHLIGPVNQPAFLDQIFLGRIGKRFKVCSPSITGNQWRYAEQVPAVKQALQQRKLLVAELSKIAFKAMCQPESLKWLFWSIPFLIAMIWSEASLPTVIAISAICPIFAFGNSVRTYLRARQSLLTDDFQLNAPVLRQGSARRTKKRLNERKVLIFSVVEVEMATCGVCGETIYETPAKCKSCSTPHHHDCWDYFGYCSVYGCGCGEAQTNKKTQRHLLT